MFGKCLSLRPLNLRTAFLIDEQMGLKEPEFDVYVAEYDSMLKGAIKGYSDDLVFFSEYKLAYSYQLMRRLGCATNVFFDFGCGIGNSIPFIRKYFPATHLICADVSSKSLNIAEERFDGQADFLLIDQDKIGIADNSVDVLFTTCVFHHIPPDEHLKWLTELYRIIKPGGTLLIFEHNPLNPVTRSIVRDCPFDKNAVLIGAKQMKEMVQTCGFEAIKVEFKVFFPQIVGFLRPLERFMSWLPIGAQYVLHARKSIYR